MRTSLVFLTFGLFTRMSWGAPPVDVQISSAIREYCHLIRFPQGWNIMPSNERGSPLEYVYDSDYEFRVPGVLGTAFLVRGVVKLTGDRYYTRNKYKIDLSDPKAIPFPATEQEWQNGTIVSDTRLDDYSRNFAPIRLTNDLQLPFGGFHFTKSGDRWIGQLARLSPDQAWIVLLSCSGKIAKRDGFLLFGGRDKGKLFFDVFNADTGKNLITIVATYLDIEPGHAINQATWVTERYFIIPLGERRERCLVCDFARAGRNGGLKP
jgi:hypothetical protein